MENHTDNSACEEQEPEGATAKLANVALADGAVLAADPDQPTTPEEVASTIVSSSAFLALGVFLTVCAFAMPNSELTGSAKKWYISPGVFPGFIGIGLMIMSFALICKAALQCRSAGHKLSLAHLRPQGGGTDTVRLVLAGALLVLYVASLGRINFTVATFLFLSVTMLSFKTKGFSPLKILVFAAVVSGAITYGFGTLARIPLP